MDRQNTAQEQFAAQLAQYGPQAPAFMGDLAAARNYCRKMAQSHYENFAVTSWLLPRDLRPHFHAVYAYCRWSDDLADEVTDPVQSRKLLDWWEHELSSCLSKRPRHPVFVALAETIREFVPIHHFHDLLIAFRQDTTRTRYESINELCNYCKHSAQSVGKIVLQLYRSWTFERAILSDSICTGLQWANFCQDVGRDWHERGRIYLPRESWAKFGISDEQEFAAPAASPNMRNLILSETARAKEYLLYGRPLAEVVPWQLGRNLDLMVQGGLAICDKIEAVGGEVLRARPRVSKLNQATLLARTWWQWRGGRRPTMTHRSMLTGLMPELATASGDEVLQ